MSNEIRRSYDFLLIYRLESHDKIFSYKIADPVHDAVIDRMKNPVRITTSFAKDETEIVLHCEHLEHFERVYE